MPSSLYSKDDIPRELQRLIDRTDRGIEQLYRLAGKSAELTEKPRYPNQRRSAAEARAQRDAYYYNPAHTTQASSPVCSGHVYSSEIEADCRRRSGQGSWSANSSVSGEGATTTEEGVEEDGNFTYSDYDDDVENNGRQRPYTRNSRANRVALRQHSVRCAHAPTARSPHRSSHLRCEKFPAPHHEMPQGMTSASTPNRTLNYSSETLSASPGPLTKPPYVPQPDLPSPSSFLSTSQRNLSGSNDRLPPWRLRQQQEDERRWKESGLRGGFSEDDNSYFQSAGEAGAAVGRGGSPSSANHNPAYRMHLAAQQSTQKPDSGNCVGGRRRRRRSLLFEGIDAELTSATPDASQEETGRVSYEGDVVEQRGQQRHGGKSSVSTSQVRIDPSNMGGRDGVGDTSSASAGMLSRFGKRWGAVFEDMLGVPPTSSAAPAASAATATRSGRRSSRKKATTSEKRRAQLDSSSSFNAIDSGESGVEGDSDCDVTRKTRRGKAVKETQPSNGQREPSTAQPTSSHINAAAETLAAGHRTPPPHTSVSAGPSINTSGVLVPATSAPAVVPSTSHTVHTSGITSSVDARYIEQLRAELKVKEEAMLQLRMDHAREMAEMRQSFTLERAAATKHTADELTATYGIQQQLLQNSLQTERERVAEAEEQLRLTRREAAQRKLDLDDLKHTLDALQSKHTTLSTCQQELLEQVAQWRAQAEKATSSLRQLEAQEKVWRAKEADWQARESQLQHQLEAGEERLQTQEASAQNVLAQVEAEFTQTSQSYQDLLAEATKRMSYLEKSHRKYKILKDSHSSLKEEHAQLVESTVQQTQRHENEVNALRAELQELRQQLHQRDSASQQASESYQETLRDYKRRLELQEANANEHAKTLQQHIDTANHTIELLRSQLEGAKQELLEEQGRSQQQQMAAAQAELLAKETLAEQQRSAAAYKVCTEDVITQQKRQLREKDAKMRALAANAAEPLQRLREQLDDERGRRARLEEQLKTYKRKAKEAEEHAAAEIRREQLRNTLLRPSAGGGNTGCTGGGSSSSAVQQRLLRSATATPSVHSTATPRPFVAGVNTMGGAGGTSSDTTARRSASAVSSATANGHPARGGYLRGVSSSGSAPNAPSLAVTAVMGTAGRDDRSLPSDGSRTARIKQTQLSQPQIPLSCPLSPLRTPLSPHSNADDVVVPPRRHVPAATHTRADGGGHAPQVAVSVATVYGNSTAAPPPQESTCCPRKPSSPSTVSLSSQLTASAFEARDKRRVQRDDTVAAASEGAVDLSAVSPSATVQSLSGISRSTPYTSTLLGEGELEKATAAASAVENLQEKAKAAESKRNDTAEGEGSDNDKDGRDVGSTSLPWYAQSARQQHGMHPNEENETERRMRKRNVGSLMEPQGEWPSSPSNQPRGDDGVGTTTQVYADAGMQAHEERMRTFHSSALEVMRRFAGSRQEALARCADIVKQTAAERRRSSQASPLGAAAAADVVSTGASETESDF